MPVWRCASLDPALDDRPERVRGLPVGDEDDPRGGDPHAARLRGRAPRGWRRLASPRTTRSGSRTSVVHPAAAGEHEQRGAAARAASCARRLRDERAGLDRDVRLEPRPVAGRARRRRAGRRAPASRSISPRSPVPPSTVAPPLPSSETTTSTSPPSRRTLAPTPCASRRSGRRSSAPRRSRSRRRPRPAAGSRSSSSTSASTFSGARATSASTAAPTPRSDRNAGWMPRANSRSSASATASFSPISSTVLDEPAVAEPRLQHPQVERERHELLLGAVVQVALDPAARVVGGLDDPQPRHPQLLHPRAQLGLQPLVVDRQRGGARRRR